MEGTSNVVHVVSVETSNRDSSVLSHVDGVLLSELVDHVLVEASEGEHTNLRSDVVPVVLIATSLKTSLQSSSHLGHSVRHGNEVVVPHLGELFISKHDVHNSGSMNRRVRVDRSGNLLDAGVDDVSLSSGAGDD